MTEGEKEKNNEGISWGAIRARAVKDFYLLIALGVALLFILYQSYNDALLEQNINKQWERWAVENCAGIVAADNVPVLPGLNSSGLNFSWGLT